MKAARASWIFLVIATVIVALRLLVSLADRPIEAHTEQPEEAGGAAAPAATISGEMAAVLLEPVVDEEESAPEVDEEESAEARNEEENEAEPMEEELPAELVPDELEVHSEEYHFRRTRWGMSGEEVKAQESGGLIREEASQLTYVTTTMGQPCLLTYGFRGDELVRARLDFHDATGMHLPAMSVARAQRQYRFLRAQLMHRYGEAEERAAHQPRDVSHLERSLRKHEEDAAEYAASIEETEGRLRRERERLEERYKTWKNRAELVSNGVAKYERDLRDLGEWKHEAAAKAASVQAEMQQLKLAETSHPLVVRQTASWAAARGLHRIELRLDVRHREPRLDVRYEALENNPRSAPYDEL